MTVISASAETKKRLEAEGAEPAYKSAADFGPFIKTEMNKWAKVVKAAGIKGE